VVAALREAVANAAGDAPVSVTVTSVSPPMYLDKDSRTYREFCDLLGSAEDRAVSYTTDAGWLSRAGMECVVCGPGSIEVAHKPNEFVPKRDLMAARGLLERAVERFCA
jgi:acetylornithine deacetylase